MNLMGPVVNKKISILLIILFINFCDKGFSQTKLLNQKISITVSEQSLEHTLELISNKGHFNFSYNSDILPIDSILSYSASEKEIAIILNEIVGDNYTYLLSGQFVVIMKKKSTKKHATKEQQNKSYTISGYLIDSRTGQKIVSATIYDLNHKESFLTDENGFYTFTFESPNESIGLEFSKNQYIDTVIIVKPNDKISLDVMMKPREEPTLAPIKMEPPQLIKVDSLSLVRKMVSEEMQIHAVNRGVKEYRVAQISFLPYAGSNSRNSGSVVNKFSFNILAGYSSGVDGIEIGGLLNMCRKNVNGIQLAGFGNITGEKTNGVQIAGFFNQNLGKVDGLQIAGFCNTVLDSIKGVQISGFSNIIKGSMKGIQVAGFTNINVVDAEAIQVSGFTNITKGNSRGQQIAGFANLTNGDNAGLQLAGFSNLVKKNCTGVQISGFTNITIQELKGSQIAGFINIAKKVEGVQVGVVNIADTVSGASIGLFNFIRKGYHRVNVYYDEMTPLNIDLAFGTYHLYTVFGVSTNPAAKVVGCNFGLGSQFLSQYKLNFNTELIATSYLIVDGTSFNTSQRYRISTHLNYNFSKHFGIFAGPSYSIFLSDPNHLTLQDYVKDHLSNHQSKTFSNAITLYHWLGFQAGLTYRF